MVGNSRLARTSGVGLRHPVREKQKRVSVRLMVVMMIRGVVGRVFNNRFLNKTYYTGNNLEGSVKFNYKTDENVL